MAAFVAWFWFWIPAEIAYSTRTMIAWSFDRLVPSRLGYVSRRFHTPVVAIGIGTAGSIVFMWLIAFHGIALLTLIEALLVIWGTAMVVAIVFPWTGKRFFNASPAKAYRFAGPPLMSVAGALSSRSSCSRSCCCGATTTRPARCSTQRTAPSCGSSPARWSPAIAWYVGNMLYRRRQGVDIELAFKQIPIE